MHYVIFDLIEHNYREGIEPKKCLWLIDHTSMIKNREFSIRSGRLMESICVQALE